jgi:murein L,D-transpeptidase YafK
VSRSRWIIAIVVAVLALVSGAVKVWLLDRAMPTGKRYTVDERLAQFGAAVQGRLAPHFAAAGLRYPPQELALVAFKDTRRLEAYAREAPNEPWHFVRHYAVLGASGSLGPKLREGDKQVPEGIYGTELLNPNSKFHLSIRVSYPNAFDRANAAREGRTNLGGDIMIHGSSFSVGCLAMGDEAAEDLFVMAALAGTERVRIVISPTDFREPAARAPATQHDWAEQLYADLRTELTNYSRGARLVDAR